MAIQKLQIYKCALCGNIVEVLTAGGGTLVCCGQDMDLLEESSTDAAQEKHVPVVEKVDGGYKVTVGSVAHPMEEAHLIEWVQLIADGRSYRQFLSPGAPPQATFAVDADDVKVREYCNLHGLWKA